MLSLARQLKLPLVVLHFARPGAPVPDEDEIALREYINELGLSGDEVPVLRCPAFEEPAELIEKALKQLGPFLDEAVPIPAEK